MATAASYGKKELVYGNQTLFRELGYYILRLEYYDKAMKVFDEAIKNTPDNIRALVGRSQARAKASYYEGAIADINRALKLDPNNLEVLAQKALNTYLSCEFEKGLVQNAQLLPIRQKPEHFSLGIMHCSNAIQTSVGDAAGRPLRDHFKIIRRLAWDKNRKILDCEAEQPTKKKKPIRRFFLEDNVEIPGRIPRKSISSGKRHSLGKDPNFTIRDSLHSHHEEKKFVPPLPEDFPFEPLQKFTSNIENVMAEKYLESMYLDKNFLKKLQNAPGISSPNLKGTEKLKKLAKTTYKMVSFKQELLRTRRPFYHIKHTEGTSTANLKTRLAQELYLQQQTAKAEAESMFARLRDCSDKKKFLATLNQAAKLRKYCEVKPKRLLPDKSKYLEEIAKILRKSYYELYRLNPSQVPWDQTKRINVAFGLPISREPSTDSVIKETKNVFVDTKKELQVLEKRLTDPALSNDEICLCYHDMCKYNIELKQYEMARIFAKHCIQEATRTNNLEWVLVITMLLIKLNVQQRNKNDARNELKKAMNISKTLKNNNLQEYLEKCVEVVNTLDFEGNTGAEELRKRENRIINLMSNKHLKDEFSHLFRTMSALPSSRRMHVIPGVRPDDDADKASIMNKSKSAFSMETVGTAQNRAANKNKEQQRGISFMNLIQYHID